MRKSYWAIIFIALITLFILRHYWQDSLLSYLFPRQEKIELGKTLIDIFNALLAILVALKALFDSGSKSDSQKLDEIPLFILTSPDKIRESLGEKGSRVNWIDRDVVSPSDLVQHPRIIIVGRMKVGKTREAAELIRRMILEDRISNNHIYDFSTGLQRYTPEILRSLLTTKLPKGTPLLTFINDLPREYVQKSLDNLTELVRCLDQCNSAYIVATARLDQLTPQHEEWLIKHKFYRIFLETLSPEHVRRLVDNCVGTLGLQIDDAAIEDVVQLNDGTPAQTILSFIQMKNEGVTRVTQIDARHYAANTLEESWRVIQSQLIRQHSVTEALFKAMAAFYYARLPKKEKHIIGFAYYLMLKKGDWITLIFKRNEFKKVISQLKIYDIVVKNNELNYPDIFVETLRLSEDNVIDDLLLYMVSPFKILALLLTSILFRESSENSKLLLSFGWYLDFKTKSDKALNILMLSVLMSSIVSFLLLFIGFSMVLVSEDITKRFESGIIRILLNSAENQLKELALFFIDNSLRRASENSFIFVLLGIIYDHINENEKALFMVQRAISIEPDNPVLQNLIGNAYYENEQNEQALIAYQKAVELVPDNPAYLENVGKAFESLGQHEMAKETYQRVIELAPDNLSYYNKLALIYRRLEHFDQAITVLIKANTLNPEDMSIQLNFAGTLLKMNRIDEAKVHLDRVKQHLDKLTKYNAACYYSLLGDSVNAMIYLQRAKDEGSLDKIWAKQDQDLISLQDDPRFEELLQ